GLAENLGDLMAVNAGLLLKLGAAARIPGIKAGKLSDRACVAAHVGRGAVDVPFFAARIVVMGEHALHGVSQCFGGNSSGVGDFVLAAENRIDAALRREE